MMKQVFLSAVCVFLLWTPSFSQNKSLNELIEYNLSKKDTIKTAFLGFEFGMKEVDCMNLMRKLVASQKLKVYANEPATFQYAFTFPNYDCFVSTKFFCDRDQLNNIEINYLSCSDWEKRPEQVYEDLALVFVYKFGTHENHYRKDATTYEWVRANCHIKLEKTESGFKITYRDLYHLQSDFSRQVFLLTDYEKKLRKKIENDI